MKNFTFLSLLFFISVTLRAQTTFDVSNYAQIGDSFIISQATAGLQTFDFEVTGANFSWDYSTLPTTTQETINWIDPNTSGYKVSWCSLNGFIVTCNTEFNNTFNLANQSFTNIGIPGFELSNIVNHYDLNSNTLENKMLGATVDIGGAGIPFTVDYTLPDVEYEFPINFNDNYTNTGSYEIDLNGFGVPLTYSETIIRTNEVEGWGSLITPFATFTDVLKMKTTVTQDIVVVTDTQTLPTTITTITFKWFDPNYGIPVLEVSGQEIAGAFVATSINYIDNQQCLSPNAFFSYLPILPEYDYNTNSSTVSFSNVSSNYDQTIWDFGDGTTSTEENPSHTFSCPGTQFVSLTVTNNICNPSETDSITLPIFITDPADAYTTSVTVLDMSLSADRITAGTTYQWIDCDSNLPINGETNQVFTPFSDGSYAVELSTNGCVSISECIDFSTLSLTDQNLDSQIDLYPNPTKGLINLSNPKSIQIQAIEIYNAFGQKVSKSLDMKSLDSGIYFVQVISDNGILSKKIIKE